MSIRRLLPIVAISGTVVALFVVAWSAGSLGRLLWTIVTTLIAISVVSLIWLISNGVLSRARNQWPVFMGLSWGIVAAGLFAIMRGNEVITALFVAEDPIAFGAGGGFFGRIEWPLVGAVIWGGGAALIASQKDRVVRLPIGIAMGALTGYLIAGHSLIWQRPAIPWAAAIGWIVLAIMIGLAFLYRSTAARPLTPVFKVAVSALGPVGRVINRTGWVEKLADSASNGIGPATRRPDPVPAVLLGAAVGWIFAVWLRSDFGVEVAVPYVAAMVPLALIGARMAWKDKPTGAQIAILEERGRALIFLGPALLFLSAALVIPAIGTIRLSFLDRDGQDSVGFANYRTYFGRSDAFDVSNWTAIFGSQLFLVAVVLINAGVLIGMFVGTKRNGYLAFDRSGASIGSIGIGLFVFMTAVFSVLRGTFFNNLWWIVTVTVMSVVLGLLVAVLAERAGRFESVAKSFIFMPLAVSFVGASIIWRLQYQARPIQKSQTGLLNWIWIKLGELSNSGWPRLLVLTVLLAIAVQLALDLYRRASAGTSFTGPMVSLLVFAYLFFQLAARSLGGFVVRADGSIVGETVLFLENRPFNNVFLMIVLIWIQTGFAMVLLSAAIKAVPSEYIEAAKVDGATDSQTFFNITLPTILPTIGVITTTLIVLVTKVFDIVKVTTNGNFGTNVLANDFFTVRFNFFDNGLGSAIAVIILLMVLPVMILNVRRMQQARNA